MKQNDLITIQISRMNRKSKDGKRKWVEFRTKMNLVVKGEEEKGKQNRWVTVQFDESINTKELSRGLLTVKVADISFPKTYEIKETVDEKTGETKKKYPIVWINAFKEFRAVEKEVENPFVTDGFDEESDNTEETESDVGFDNPEE